MYPTTRMIHVSDARDPRLADYRDLHDQRARSPDRAPDRVIIEGHLALQRTLQGPLGLRSVLMTPQRAASLAELCARVPVSVPIFVADREVLEGLTGFDVHRGVLASAQRPVPMEPLELIEAHPRLAVLAGLTDLENVGAAFRVAAAFGLGAVLLDDRCADPLYRRCVRVSLGWSTVIPHARLAALPDGLAPLREAHCTTVALTPARGALTVERAAAGGVLDDPVALLVGAEGAGLDPVTIAAADHAVVIPMAEGVDSLNAATALAVVAAFAAARRGRGDPAGSRS